MVNGEAFGEGVNFEGMPAPFFLIGLLNEFNNRFQAAGDAFFKEVSWKQGFLINCITFFKEPPTVRQLADLVGCSHQNTKQMLNKLEKGGFVELLQDENDKRKLRIILTHKTAVLREKYSGASAEFMQQLFGNVTEQEIGAAIGTIMKLDSRLKELTKEHENENSYHL